MEESKAPFAPIPVAMLSSEGHLGGGQPLPTHHSTPYPAVDYTGATLPLHPQMHIGVSLFIYLLKRRLHVVADLLKLLSKHCWRICVYTVYCMRVSYSVL